MFTGNEAEQARYIREEGISNMEFIDWTLMSDPTMTAPVDWIVPNIIPGEGQVSCLFGKDGTGKSLLTLHFAIQAQPLHVIYVDNEMTTRQVLSRAKFLAGTSQRMEHIRYTIPGQHRGLNREEVAAQFHADLPANPDWVIFDTIASTVSGNENMAETFQPWNDHIIQPLKDRGVAVTIVDHLGKGDDTNRPRGSSDKGALVDVFTYVTKGQTASGRPVVRCYGRKDKNGIVQDGQAVGEWELGNHGMLDTNQQPTEELSLDDLL